MKKHKKHSQIAKPKLGEFGRLEFSILGTTCDEIKKIANRIATNLSSDDLEGNFKVSYVDADHKSADDKSSLSDSAIQQGFEIDYLDKIDFQRIDLQNTPNKFTRKKFFNDQDIVIINGNHFESDTQVVVLDPRKNLEKKLHKLTNVELIIYTEEDLTIPDYLRDAIPNIDEVPIMAIYDRKILSRWVLSKLKNNIAPLKGLVLAGGKSERMQQDKSLIEYHGESQKSYMTKLLASKTENSFLAVRSDQEEFTPCIKDTFTGLGPYGAILSAFREDPNSAWLVTACDQPFIDSDVIDLLIKHRDPSKVATAFYNPETGFPEPLITIWEPKSYPHLLDFLGQGYSCPRKVLINTDIALVKLEDASVLHNVNTPEEYKKAKEQLESKVSS